MPPLEPLQPELPETLLSGVPVISCVLSAVPDVLRAEQHALQCASSLVPHWLQFGEGGDPSKQESKCRQVGTCARWVALFLRVPGEGASQRGPCWGDSVGGGCSLQFCCSTQSPLPAGFKQTTDHPYALALKSFQTSQLFC